MGSPGLHGLGQQEQTKKAALTACEQSTGMQRSRIQERLERLLSPLDAASA